MKQKNKLIIILVLTIFVISSLFFISYGYMGSDVSGNETAKEFVNLSQILKVEYSGGTENLTTKEDGYFAPGSILTKTFSIKNTGNVSINYGVKLSDVVNNFERIEDLEYELYLEDTLLNKDIFPGIDMALAYNQTINVGETKNYTLKVIYKESEENQIVDQNKIINAKIDFVQTKNTLSNIKLLGNSVQGRLSSEYQEVEYIQNDGNQYIDTGVVANENNSFEAKAQLVHTNTASQTLWGGRGSANSGSIQGNQLSFVKSTATYQFVSGNEHKATLKWDTNLHTFYANKNTLYIDDVLIYTITSATITKKNNVYLFATNTAGTVGFNGGSLKIYYFKIWNNDTLVREFVPCYRKLDNVIGMYDLVEGKFYTNQGTGTFQKGGNIEPTLTNPLEIKSVGEKTVNLFDVNKWFPDYTNDKNGISFTEKNLKNINSVQIMQGEFEENEQYTLSFEYKISALNNFVSVYIYYTDGTNTRDTTSMRLTDTEKVMEKSGKLELTSSKGKTVERIRFSYSTTSRTCNVEITNFQIEKGTKATKYEPYGKYKIPIIVESKNLLPFPYTGAKYDLETLKWQIRPDRKIIANGFATEYSAISLYKKEEIPKSWKNKQLYVKAIGTYKNVTSTVHLIDESGQEIADVGYLHENKGLIDMSLYPEAKYFTLEIKRRSNNLETIADFYIMIVEDKDMNTFEPYLENINIYLDEPLRKLGSYADYIDIKNKTVVRKNVKKYLADYSNWASSTEYDNHYTFCVRDDNILPNYSLDLKEHNYSFCNILKVVDSWDYSIHSNALFMHKWASNIRVSVSKDELSDGTVATFKSWLSDKNPYMIRIRAEEETNEIDIPINLYSINPDANIIIDTTLQASVVIE